MPDLDSMLPRLPPEGQASLNGLSRFRREPTERKLSLIDADNFIRHWRTVRDEQQRLAYDFDQP
jgi:hypothetical protein